jgi:UTP--glucose-1-phosphate uridylyltransferase
MKEIKKAIFPIAGLATRFLPFSKAVSKELIPLVDKPLIHYNVEEALLSGIKKIEFIARPGQKDFLNYFNRDTDLEKFLEEKGKKEELKNLKEVEGFFKEIGFSVSTQKKASGDTNAIYQAKKFIGKDPCGIFFCDDVVKSEEPCFSQLVEVFKTCDRPVLALMQMPENRLSSYGIVKVEKIANSFYKIKKVVQKPKQGEAPSNLAILGRMIITPDVIDFIGSDKTMIENDYSITQVLGRMAEEGKPVYGYEIKGEWLECGNKKLWLNSFVDLLINDPEFGFDVRKKIKEMKI